MFETDQTRSFPRENLDAGRYPAWPEGSRAQANPMGFANEELVLGRFRVIRLLGVGGMGEVYEAEDLQLGRIALKTLRREIAANPVQSDHFRQEVQLARRVSHPNVCRIHEFFPADDSLAEKPPFFTMEYLDGITLREKLQKAGPYPWREAEIVIRAICYGLDAIHVAGITHRDLKPRNIMLMEKTEGSCRVVLTDFGLAVDTPFHPKNGEESDRTAEQNPMLAGTLDYMAPEQFEGRPVSAATDVYALGVILYELVTGKRPFASNETINAGSAIGAAARRARRLERPSQLSRHLPPGWDSVIFRCLEYDPAHRYQSAGEVAKALHANRTTLGRAKTATRNFLRRPSGRVLVACSLLFLCAGIWYWRSQHAYHRPSPEVESWYQKGLVAIRDGTYVKATRVLQIAADKDPRYAIAHARLAEAWSELDFDGNAQQEMLKASALEQQQHLPQIDRDYVDAVRDTLTHDYGGATLKYRHILDRLPASEKAAGYVDLGRAEEKQGKIAEALADYGTAAHLDESSPVAFIHMAILESRLQKRALSEQHFVRAEGIYRDDVNVEGLAEVAYRRGYAANDQSDPVQAREYLKRSLDLSSQIPSVQGEIRALTQLSDLAAEAGDDKNAIDEANQAIQLARQKGLRYWEAIGLVRLGGAYLDASDPAQRDLAEDPLQQAIRIAKDDDHPRAEAEAKLNLASLRDLQRRPEEVISLARAARDIYAANGSRASALDASTLLIRAQIAQGNLQDALRSSADVLAPATASGNPREIMFAEELTAKVLLLLERYPESLDHYRKAMAVSTTSNRTLFQINCAEVLLALGQLAEADRILSTLPNDSSHNQNLLEARARLLIEKGNYDGVQSLVSPKDIQEFPDVRGDLEMYLAIAKWHTGHKDAAREQISQVILEARQQHDVELWTRGLRVQMQLSDLEGSPLKRRDQAESLSRHFFSTGQQESELYMLYYLAISEKQLGNRKASADAATKAINIVHEWQQSWSASLQQSYNRQPEVITMLRDLEQCKALG